MTHFTRDMLILGYAGMAGFVAAGILASFYQWWTSLPPRFVVLGRSVLALVTTAVFCLVTGPIVVLDHALQLQRQARQQPLRWICAGVLVAALWSCCSGIFVLGLMVILRSSFV